MMPPECAITGEDAGEDGGLVYFAHTAGSRAWEARAQAEPGFVGHPPNAVWLAGEYYERGSALAHLTWPEARRLLLESA